MDDNEIIEKHRILDYILHVNDGFLWQDVLRSIGGGLVITLTWLNTLLEDIVSKIITFNNFYSTGAMGEFMEVLRPLIWGVFFIALLVLGFQFITNKVERRNEVLLNVIMAVCFIVVIPDLMSKMSDVLDIGINQIKPENETLAGNVVKSNVADVLYYAENDFQFSSSKRGEDGLPPRPANKEDSSIGTTDFTYANRLSNLSAMHVPYLQKLDLHEDDGWIFKKDWVKELSEEAKEILNTKSVPTGVGDGYQVEELQKNAIPTTKIGRETYYRYHVNWLPLITTLLITTIALGISIIKIGRAIFDLAFHQIFGMFVAASDLTGGQRTKKVLIEIMNTYVVIFIMMLLLQVFIMFTTWANGLKAEIGTFGVIFMLIAGAWALIDAPDIIQRQLGIDAGLRSGWQSLMGAYAATKAVGAAGKAATNFGKDMKNKALGNGKKGVSNNSNIEKRAVKEMNDKPAEEKNDLKQNGRSVVAAMPGNGNIKDGDTKHQTDIPSHDTLQSGQSSAIAATSEEMTDTGITNENLTPIPISTIDNEASPVNGNGKGIANISPQKINSQNQNNNGITGTNQPNHVSPGTNTTDNGSPKSNGVSESMQSILPMPGMDASLNSDLQTPIQRQESTPIPASSHNIGVAHTSNNSGIVKGSGKKGKRLNTMGRKILNNDVQKLSQPKVHQIPVAQTSSGTIQNLGQSVTPILNSNTGSQESNISNSGVTIQNSSQSVRPIPSENVDSHVSRVSNSNSSLPNQSTVKQNSQTQTASRGSVPDTVQSVTQVPSVNSANQANQVSNSNIPIPNQNAQARKAQNPVKSNYRNGSNSHDVAKRNTSSQQNVKVQSNNNTTTFNQTNGSDTLSRSIVNKTQQNASRVTREVILNEEIVTDMKEIKNETRNINQSVNKLKNTIEGDNKGLLLGRNLRRFKK